MINFGIMLVCLVLGILVQMAWIWIIALVIMAQDEWKEKKNGKF